MLATIGWYAALPLVLKIILWIVAVIAGCYAIFFIVGILLTVLAFFVALAGLSRD